MLKGVFKTPLVSLHPCSVLRVPLWGGQAVILNSFFLQYHETINEALEAVPYDGVIIIHWGVYDEHLSVNKPVAIIGASMWSSFLSIIILFWESFKVQIL